MKNICVVTGTRAEYGLLYWTMSSIRKEESLNLQVVATGMHLSPEFGNTYKIIEDDGFIIDKKVEMLLSSDTAVGISKSMGLAIISFAEVLHDLEPDLLLVLGDRYEIFAAVSAAMISRIPVAHCHGGEATEGLIDEPIRHSITKMSHFHFTSTDEYKKRIIQLGEHPKRVFNVGALGIEGIKKCPLMTKNEFEESTEFKFNKKKSILVTFHPVTLEKATAEYQIDSLLQVLEDQDDIDIIFTKSNSDTDGRIINTKIEEFVIRNPDTSKVFTSLGQIRYLSAINLVDVVVGNSSSGIIEVPSFKKATINIGDRQKGRIAADSIINCGATKKDIKRALDKAMSNDFKKTLENVDNPYEGSCNPSEYITECLRDLPLDDLLIKKFHDLA